MTAPSTFSKARPNNIYMTTHRTRSTSAFSERVMRELGVPIVNWQISTQSRWDASRDGLHYCATGLTSDDYVSQVSLMNYHIGLNAMLGECS